MISTIWPTLEGVREEEFRATKGPEERRRLTVLAAVVLTTGVVYVPIDLGFGGAGAEISTVLGLRGLVVMLSVAVILVSRSGVDHRRRDPLVTAWALAFVVLDVASSAIRPPEYVGYIALTPLVVLALYTVIPAPPSYLTGLAVVESVGTIFVVVASELDRTALFTFIVALVAAHAIGITAMWSLHRLARDEFLALRAEREARSELQQVVEEIRTLRGVLPICASCKKIRDDEGAWRQMEDYVTERSEARFSHGLCPSCLEDLYGEG